VAAERRAAYTCRTVPRARGWALARMYQLDEVHIDVISESVKRARSVCSKPLRVSARACPAELECSLSMRCARADFRVAAEHLSACILKGRVMVGLGRDPCPQDLLCVARAGEEELCAGQRREHRCGGEKLGQRLRKVPTTGTATPKAGGGGRNKATMLLVPPG
jgi:hypothetical protein